MPKRRKPERSRLSTTAAHISSTPAQIYARPLHHRHADLDRQRADGPRVEVRLGGRAAGALNSQRVVSVICGLPPASQAQHYPAARQHQSSDPHWSPTGAVAPPARRPANRSSRLVGPSRPSAGCLSQSPMGARSLAERCHLGGAVWLRMAASASATSRRLTSNASVLRMLEIAAPAAIRGTTERWW